MRVTLDNTGKWGYSDGAAYEITALLSPRSQHCSAFIKKDVCLGEVQTEFFREKGSQSLPFTAECSIKQNVFYCTITINTHNFMGR